MRFPRPADWNDGRIDWVEVFPTLSSEKLKILKEKIQADAELTMYFRFAERMLIKNSPNEKDNLILQLKDMYIILEESTSATGMSARQKFDGILESLK